MCTRILWSSAGVPGQGNVLVARSMDWFQDTQTILAVQPRGVERESAPGDPGSFTWTSKFGSVVSLMYGKVAVDGINEAGFQTSGLYLAESDYGERDASRPGIGLELAIQCALDRFDSVKEAVDWVVNDEVQVIPIEIAGKPGTGHLSFADASGDSAIVEFIDGHANVYHGDQFTIMANSPSYDQQLELVRRFAGMGGELPIPGGTDSPERFARAAYYAARLPRADDTRESVAYAFSAIRAASSPFGTADETRPNISSTLWRTVADLTNRLYFFESSLSPNVIWVDLASLSFEPGPARILDFVNHSDHTGNVTSEFVPVAA